MTTNYLFWVQMAICFLVLVACRNEPSNAENKNTENRTKLEMEADSILSARLHVVQLLLDTANWKGAESNLQSIRHSSDFIHYSEASKSRLYHHFGVLYFKKDQYYQSINYLDSALYLQEKLPNIDPGQKAYTYSVRSQAMSNLSRNQEALKDIQNAISLAEPIGDTQNLIDYYIEIAVVYQNTGDFGQAQFYYEKAKDLIGDKQEEQLANLYNNRGNFYGYQGQFDQQQSDFEKAMNIYKKLGKSVERNYLMTELNFNASYLYKGELAKAGNYFRKSLQKIKALEEPYPGLQEQCLNNLGWLELAQKNHKKSEAYYRELLAWSKQYNPSDYGVWRARSFEALGDIRKDLGEYEKAIRFYHRAIQSLCPGFDTENIYENPVLKEHPPIDKTELLRILGFKSEAILAKYQRKKERKDLDALLDNYQCQDAIIIDIRQSFKAAVSRFDQVANNLTLYEQATRTALELYDLTKEQHYLFKAFNLATKNKAIVLQEGLQDEKAKFAGIPNELLKKESQLKKERFLIEAELADKEYQMDQAKRKMKREERFELIRTYEQLILSFEENYPRYHELKYALNYETNPQAILEQLPENAAMIEYFVGHAEIFVFTISQQGIQFHRQVKPENFAQQCRQFRDLFQSDEEVTTPSSYTQVAHDLFQLLLKEPLANLKQQDDLERLIIIPDDVLLLLSFDALLTQPFDPAGKQLRWSNPQIPYLIRDYALSYAYSNQLIFDQQATKRIRKAVQSFAGFGLEYDDLTLKEINQMANLAVDTTITRGMGKLYHSVEEIKKVQQIVGQGQLWINGKATKQAFLKHAPSARLLHLAMHGYEASDHPMNAALVFSQGSTQQDFLLKSAELYALDLNADMTVLSACHTGSGQIQKGEGVRSLARAFRYTGCPSLLATLWAVSDYSTKEIVVTFYEELKQGTPKDVALQRAKLNYLTQAQPSQTMPFYWTNLVMIGETKALEF